MNGPGRIELDLEQIEALLDRIEQQKLTEGDYPLIADLIRSMTWVSQKLEDQKLTLHRLRKLFGVDVKTEKTSNLPDSPNSSTGDKSEDEAGGAPPKDRGGEATDNAKDGEKEGEGKGDGRKNRKSNRPSASDYKAAIITRISHQSLRVGDRCPECKSGNLRKVDPGKVLRIIGQPWLQAHIYEQERFRCNTCGKTFTARLPKDIARAPKYDKSAKAIVSLLKYRGGFPFYRQESLQAMLETPISDSVLWKMTNDVAKCLAPVYEEMIKEASKGECIHNDDTKARVLDLIQENKNRNAAKERTGIFTTAILSHLETGRQIALFFTGRQHAGENLNDVLSERPEGLSTPTQMCDSLNNNKPQDCETDEANCLAHLRRKFYEIAEIWPTYVLPIILYLNCIWQRKIESARGLKSRPCAA